MQFLRWTVIATLLLGLPTLAVFGDVQQVYGLFAHKPQSPVSIVTPEQVVASPTEPLDNVTPPTEKPGGDQPPAVYPTFTEPETADKELRSAIYRPFADDNRKPILRTPAELASTGELPTHSIEEMESELRAMGARRYRMDEVNGAFVFSCEFAPHTAGEAAVTFKSQSTTGEAAMGDAIRQAQLWQRRFE